MDVKIDKYVFDRPVYVPWLDKEITEVDLLKPLPNTDVTPIVQIGLIVLSETNGSRVVGVPMLATTQYGKYSAVASPIIFPQDAKLLGKKPH